MYCIRKVTDAIDWVGGNDRRLALFENIFPIPDGVSYNSYVIKDEKTALMDTADDAITRQFIENVKESLGGRKLNYLVINHMEPDHCGNIEEIVLRFPEVVLVGNQKTFQMIDQFFDFDLTDRKIIVKENDILSLGIHTLHFAMAPMVHWPEAMVTYEEKEKILFSADAFGSFGALNGNLFNDEINFDRDWLDDARRYYTNIVGKYGSQVQAVLKKASGLDIQMICPLHGPVWRSDIAYFIDKYAKWSTYEPEEEGIVIIYGSMYGNTENMADVLAAKLAEAGAENVVMHDVSGTDVSYLIADIFRYSHIVLAAPTYNSGIYPPMLNLIHDMKALNVQNRKIGLIGNGTWGPTVGKQMTGLLSEMKNMTILEPAVLIKSRGKENNLEDLEALKEALMK